MSDYLYVSVHFCRTNCQRKDGVIKRLRCCWVNLHWWTATTSLATVEWVSARHALYRLWWLEDITSKCFFQCLCQACFQ